MRYAGWFFGGLLLGLGPPVHATVPCGSLDSTELELLSITRNGEARPLPASVTGYLSSYTTRDGAFATLPDPEGGPQREIALTRAAQ